MALLLNDKGGKKLQGMISDFLCESSKITAGEFVNYVNELNVVKAKNISSISGSGDYIFACELTKNRVFIIHKDSANYSILDATLVSVENNDIVELKNYTIYNSDSASYHAKCIALDSSRVLVTCGNGGNFNYLVGFIVTVTDAEMKFDAPTVLVSRNNSCSYTNLIKLSNDKVLVIHNSETNEGYISAILLNISGTTITATEDKTLYNATKWASENMSAVLIDENKVLVVHGTGRFNTDSKVGAFIITIDGDTLTASQDKILIDSIGSGMNISACLLTENKAMVSHRFNKDNNTLSVFVAEVKGNEITIGQDVNYPEYRGDSNQFHLISHKENEAIMVHIVNESSYSISAMIIGTEGLEIVKFKPVEFNRDVGSGYSMRGVKLSDGRVFFAHKSQQSASYLSGILANVKKEASTMKDKTNFYGVATQTRTQ